MLIAVAIVSAVGGAFAFTSKFNQPICYTTIPNGTTCFDAPPTCATKITGKIVDGSGSDLRCYTILSSSLINCSSVSCPETGVPSLIEP